MHKYFIKLTALSLIEILITITIVLILCSVSLYSYQDYKMTALYNSALAIVEQNKLIISSFYAKNKSCPANSVVNQTPTSTSFWSNVTNIGCTINLNGSKGLILSFQAVMSDLGDIQYYCAAVGPNYPEASNYVPSCPATAPSGTAL